MMDPPRDLRDMFRHFFGFSHFDPFRDQRQNDIYSHPHQSSSNEDVHDNDANIDIYDRNSRGFTVYSDPLEIHKYFDQQMDEMLKIFGGFGFGGGGFYHQGENFEGFGGVGPRGNKILPFEENDDKHESAHARGFMLKDEGQPKVDTEVEWDKVDMTELDQIMKHQDKTDQPPRHIRPFGGHQDWGFSIGPGAGQSFSFGSSVSEKTKRNSNGGIETTRSVR